MGEGTGERSGGRVDDGCPADRLEVSVADAAAYRARREALHAATDELDRELELLERQERPDMTRLRAVVRRTLGTLRIHIEEAEAPDGLLADITEAAPWFAARADELRRDHDDLLERTELLRERADAADRLSPLVEEVRGLSARITEHRHQGTALLLDAYLLDIPAGD